ncbi:MAG TPA: 4-carboxymuconolactone decarboxylase [Dehalococcoidia bacterium]|nr:4-carboxymuconolactone decarboxylase [Dehalococcoidia bacterium]
MSKKFEEGLRIRKEVLGETYVNESFENATSFDKPFQEFITESAWGGVWSRGPLDRKTKSIITLSVLIALKSDAEIALHTKGAIENGVSPEELLALLIHSSVYAGVPASLSAMKTVKKVLGDMGKLPSVST